MTKRNLALFYTIFIISLLAVWEYCGQHNDTFRLLLSSPSLAWHYTTANWPMIQNSILMTFWASAGGFLISILLSAVLILICLYVRSFMQILMPPLILLQGMPIVSLAPFFIIILGSGLPSKLAMAVIITFFPIFLNLAAGINTIPRNVHEFLDIYNAPRFTRIRRVYLPLALPQFMSGLKIASTLTVIGVLVSEVIVSDAGLGRMVYLSAIRLQPELFVVSLLLSSLMGMVFYMIVVLIERWAGYWYVQQHTIFKET